MRYTTDPRVEAFIDALPDWPALTAMFRQIIANNRAGGWRKLKREAGAR